MSEWIHDYAPALALVVSALSLFVSVRVYQRQNAEKAVNAWIVLEKLQPEWWLATLNVENNSHLGIDIDQLNVELPDYRLGDLAKAREVQSDGMVHGTDVSKTDHYLAMPFKYRVDAGGTLHARFLLHQPAHSRRKNAKINVSYYTLEPKRKRRGVRVVVRTRNDM